MKIGFTVPKTNTAKITARIADRVAKVQGKLGSQIYNQIILIEDVPIWSASYVSSWNLAAGSPDTSFNPPPENIKGTPNVSYAIPSVQFLENVPRYTGVYVSNYAPHAGKVEFEGTPLHPDPWMVAHHAKNSILKGFKF